MSAGPLIGLSADYPDHVTWGDACIFYSCAVWIATGEELDPDEWWRAGYRGELWHVPEGVARGRPVLREILDPAEVARFDVFGLTAEVEGADF